MNFDMRVKVSFMKCRILPVRSIALGTTLALAGVGLLPQRSLAAPIVWGAATNITGVTDVSTAGSLLAAYNFGGANVAATTINGVTFQPFAIAGNPTTTGDFSVQESPGQLFGSNTLFGSTSAPLTNLPLSYQTLLQSGVYSQTPSAITLTMNNLTVGQTYQLQWWTNTSNGFTNNNFVTALAGNSVTLSPNTSQAVGGLGQYVIGIFIADSTTQTVRYTGSTSVSSSGPVINGFQIRAVSTPEPGTLTLLIFGGVGVALSGCRMATRRMRAASQAS